MDQVREQIKRRTATVRHERGASSLGRRQKPANQGLPCRCRREFWGYSEKREGQGQSGGVLMAAWSSHAVVRLIVLELVVQKLCGAKEIPATCRWGFFFFF